RAVRARRRSRPASLGAGRRGGGRSPTRASLRIRALGQHQGALRRSRPRARRRDAPWARVGIRPAVVPALAGAALLLASSIGGIVWLLPVVVALVAHRPLCGAGAMTVALALALPALVASVQFL